MCRGTHVSRPVIRACLLLVVGLATVAIVASSHGYMAMSQTLDAKERQEFLDRFYPFIEQGQEPPGRVVPSEKLGGTPVWQGQLGWRIRHGPAIVIWSLGRPNEVENALYPDGSRGEVLHMLDHGFRRRASGDRLWVYGRIDIRPDDVTFVDGDQPVYQPPPQSDVPNLEADLAHDPAFLAAIRDDRFALAVVTVFDNRTFYKGGDPRAWPCGSRQAAGLVADLRGKGESYQDYFPIHATLAGIYPDDRPAAERQLLSRIDQISKLITRGLPPYVPLEDMIAYLGPGEHPPEEVRRAMELIRRQREKQGTAKADNEKYREQQLAALEEAERALAAFRADHTNEDVLEALRAHLSRLGWRTETIQDRDRVHKEWLARALQVLREVKELEKRPAAPPGAWAIPFHASQIYGRSFDPKELENISPDVRTVENGGLEIRLRNLVTTGRVTEQEYRSLIAGW